MEFPALSFTVPGEAVVVSVFVEYVFVLLPVQPLPPVSLHVPVNVLFPFVQFEFPPLLEHVGGVLSIITVWSDGQVAEFPALS